MKHEASLRLTYCQLQSAKYYKRWLNSTTFLTDQQRAIALRVMVRYIRQLRRQLTEIQFAHAEQIAEATAAKYQFSSPARLQKQLGQCGGETWNQAANLDYYDAEYSSESGAWE